MTDIIKEAKALAALKVPHMRAEVSVHEEEDPRYTDDCLVQIIEKDDENSIWYEEEHGGYEHGKLHFAHVFAAAPEHTQALAEETWEYAVQVTIGAKWLFLGRGVGGHNLAQNAFWFDSKQKAHAHQALCQKGELTRIVRRRVSPVEVI